MEAMDNRRFPARFPCLFLHFPVMPRADEANAVSILAAHHDESAGAATLL